MSYLFNEFEDKDRIPFLESEITRLQDMCRTNFSTIDDLKKQNRKLCDVQTELKETTSDLAYSLAECPWWEEETIKESVKVLASFTQKIQYILELPTFLDPFEQLERNGIHDMEKVKQYLRRQRRRMKKMICFRCLKCRRTFRLKSNYKTHMGIHKKVKKLKCRICPGERFATFPLLKFHVKKMHSNANSSKIPTHLLESDSESSSQRKEFAFNHLKISKFVKCPKCEGTFRSIQAYNRHQNFCRFPRIPENMNQKSKDEIPTNHHRRISNSTLKSVSSGNSSDVIILDLSEVEMEKEVINLEDENVTSKANDLKYEFHPSVDFGPKNGARLSRPDPFLTSFPILGLKSKMEKVDYKLEDFDVNHLMKRGLTMACSSCKESFNSNQDLINHMKTHLKQNC